MVFKQMKIPYVSLPVKLRDSRFKIFDLSEMAPDVKALCIKSTSLESIFFVKDKNWNSYSNQVHLDCNHLIS